MVRTQTLRYWIGQQQKSFYMQWRPNKKEALQHHAVSDQYRLFFVGVANQNSCVSQTHQTNCIQVSLLRCFWGVKRPGLSGKPHIDIIDVEWLVLDATRGKSGALGKAFWFGTFHCCFFVRRTKTWCFERGEARWLSSMKVHYSRSRSQYNSVQFMNSN